jgi:hypothetical protein
VPLAKTIVAPPPTLPPPPPNATAQYNPYAETAREWPPPPTTQVSTPRDTAPPRRSSLLVPLTVLSILLAVASLAVLGYFIYSRSQANEEASRADASPQPTASPTLSNSSVQPQPSAKPSPTAQTTPTPTPTPTPKPTPNTEPPPGARLGYCNDTNVLVRNAPNLDARPITKIQRGQKLWIIGTSSNYSTWNGITSNWTQVQLYNSSVRGWVFSPFVSSQ